MLTQSVCLKKCTHVKIILKNLTQIKKTKHMPSGYGQLEYLGENAERYITFSVGISKEIDNGK